MPPVLYEGKTLGLLLTKSRGATVGQRSAIIINADENMAYYMRGSRNLCTAISDTDMITCAAGCFDITGWTAALFLQSSVDLNRVSSLING